MPADLSLTELIHYTDWERRKWHERLLQHGDQALEISAGPHGDGRLSTVGEIVRHIFSAEQRYAERLQGKPLTDFSSMPSNSVAKLFELGRQSRTEFRNLIENFPDQEWNAPKQFQILTYSITVTPRGIVTHVVMHEIRHWAQIATILRLNGLKGEFHDYLFFAAGTGI